MVVKALDLSTPNLRDLAREAGISYHAARAYSKGERLPSPEVRHRLATALRRFSAKLQWAADELEMSATIGGKP